MSHASSLPDRLNGPKTTSGRPARTPSSTTIKMMLRQAGLRPTRQRIALSALLFGQRDRHVSAEQLFEEANLEDKTLSLATVYNTLRQFKQAGLLREVLAAGPRSCFDTKTEDHHHFVVEEDGTVFDAPGVCVSAENLPTPPKGYEVIGVDVLIRLKRVNTEEHLASPQ